ncbi:class I SAM-dependent methyltransferase [Bailinhaonella thermotolerans]|uniref:Class I SAM-dependent methyltransferase n=1 Tax=Bailinhaonella thermotolerans TaxID=1070861 RepID=A0A3A4AFV9_9ACTN|nr:class I SAM-dependent methyltransferase [Bailinhaonella thermotolerans]RJL27239.1 class I SAM-dependent methyltransferase [Bailinhaonella thermotolerans]
MSEPDRGTGTNPGDVNPGDTDRSDVNPGDADRSDANRDEAGRDGRDEAGRDEAGRDEAGRDEADRSDAGRDDAERVKERVAEIWGFAAPGYDGSWGHGLKTGAEKRAWTAALARMLPPGPLRLLDAGCGTGFLTLLLAEAGHEVVGLDLSEGMLAVAAREAERRGLRPRLVRGDAERPPAGLGPFDAVVSRHLLWTLPEPERAVRAWRGLLRPGGLVLAIDEFWPPLSPAARLAVRAGRLLDRLAGEDDGGGYPPDLAGRLPLHRLADPGPVREVFERAGLTGVGVEPLTEVDRAERAVMPLRLKLGFDYRRYLIRGSCP